MKKAYRLVPVAALLVVGACTQGSVTRNTVHDALTSSAAVKYGVTPAIEQCVEAKLFASSVSQSTRDDIGHATSPTHLSTSEKALVDKIVADCRNATTVTTAGPGGATTSTTG